jgi:transcriptional regulator with XRE-family HTH domain
MRAKIAENELRRRIIGRFLKEARIEAGLTQGHVAKSLAYSTAQFVSNWERGLALPPLDVLPRLAKLLSIPPREMIETVHRYQDELLKVQKRQVFELFRRQLP